MATGGNWAGDHAGQVERGIGNGVLDGVDGLGRVFGFFFYCFFYFYFILVEKTFFENFLGFALETTEDRHEATSIPALHPSPHQQHPPHILAQGHFCDASHPRRAKGLIGWPERQRSP